MNCKNRPLCARSSALALVCSSLFLGTSVPVHAASDNINLAFDVYASNIKAFKISIGMNIGEQSYSANARIKSKGLVSFVSSAKINFNVEGKLNVKGIEPTRFTSNSEAKGKKRSVTMSWDSKRFPQAKLSHSLNDERKAQLKAVVKPGMTDPISQLVRLVARNPDGMGCNGTQRVYTGKVVDEYRVRFVTLTKFGANAGGIYRGPAYKCEVKFRTIAGISPEKQKKQKAQDPTLTIWYAPVTGSTGTLLVPVGAAGNIDGRQITARLSEGVVSGKSLGGGSPSTRKKRFEASTDR